MSASTQSNSDRIFPVFDRGEVREDLLSDFRLGLVGLVNPDTGQPFTAQEIAAATAMGSDKWKEAESLDLVAMAEQQRGLWLSDQAFPTRASTAYLQNLWGPLWLPDGYLAASPGSGPVDTTAVPDTVWIGSTTVPDPAGAAVYGTDPQGLRYQVLFTETADANGDVSLVVAAFPADAGPSTNLPVDTVITWANAPVTATSTTGKVTTKFTGGLPAETDAGFAARIVKTIRHKPAAGNNAQTEQWAETSGNNDAVETGWVYSTALNAGSCIVAVTQNRGGTQGPTGRIPSAATLAQVTTYLTPPGSPVMPGMPFIFVKGVTGVSCDMVLTLQMPVGSASGYDDLQPFPGQSGGTPAQIAATPAWQAANAYIPGEIVTNAGNTYYCVTGGLSGGPAGPTSTTANTPINDGGVVWNYYSSQSAFLMTSPVALPPGVTAPQMMVWNASISRFEELTVLSVTLLFASTYVVLLGAPAEATLTAGVWVSPYSQQIDLLGETVENYFDSLGPGELVNLTTDPRAVRAYRYPVPSEEFPQIAGTGVITYLEDALGASLALGILDYQSVTTPPVPTDPALGPNLIVCGRVGVYPQ